MIVICRADYNHEISTQVSFTKGIILLGEFGPTLTAGGATCENGQ